MTLRTSYPSCSWEPSTPWWDPRWPWPAFTFCFSPALGGFTPSPTWALCGHRPGLWPTPWHRSPVSPWLCRSWSVSQCTRERYTWRKTKKSRLSVTVQYNIYRITPQLGVYCYFYCCFFKIWILKCDSSELFEVSFLYIYTANEGCWMFLCHMVTVKQKPHLLWVSLSSTALFVHPWPPFSVLTHNTDHHSHDFALIALLRVPSVWCFDICLLCSAKPRWTLWLTACWGICLWSTEGNIFYTCPNKVLWYKSAVRLYVCFLWIGIIQNMFFKPKWRFCCLAVADRYGQRAPAAAREWDDPEVCASIPLSIMQDLWLYWLHPSILEGARGATQTVIHSFIHVNSMCGVYTFSLVLEFSHLVMMIQPVTFHSAVTKLQNYRAEMFCDCGVCISTKQKQSK